MILAGWGRYPRLDCRVHRPRDVAALRTIAGEGSLIARGNGRAYGDSALNPLGTVDMRGFNRILAFDSETGQVVAETGVMLAELIDVFLPRGWFPSVTPGTKLVTLGGAIAADVHGKNHHKHGAFSTYVDWLDIFCPDGEVRRASRTENPDVFAWTLGGMGLTGVILRAAVRLTPVETGWLRQRLLPAPNLRSAIEIFEREQDATYSVAWIDCLVGGRALGRSLVMLGEHATLDELGPSQRADRFAARRRSRKTVPFDFPRFALNGWTVRAFNALYYLNGQRQAGESLIDFDSYFYPLDAILEWNRIYGRSGFTQFQCVIPLEHAAAGIEALLRKIGRSGQGSFLAVLKRMGRQESRFSFPMEGYTLALDFPIRATTRQLFKDLERIAVDHGGRFYLAKDSFLDAGILRAADPRSNDFVRMRRETGAAAAFSSAQSERLEL